MKITSAVTPSLPDADPRSDRSRCGGRESNFLAAIDDYGHWQGARRAVDQYFAEQKLHLLLDRSDYTGRMCVKLGP